MTRSITLSELKQEPKAKRIEWLRYLVEHPDQANAMLFAWSSWARKEQLEPKRPGWLIWFVKAGRGWGKTRTAAEFIKEQVEAGNARRIGLGGADPQEIRKTMLEGESGLLTIYPDGHPNKPVYIANKKEVHWPCGAIAFLFSGEIPEKPRGDQFDLVWCDELAAWKYPDQVWANLQFCRRLKGPNGHPSRIIVTTTPKPLKVIRNLMKDPNCVVTGGSSYDNMNNLDDSYKVILDRYEGTRLGRQEIEGDVIDEDADALWKRSNIDKFRALPDDVPPMRRIVVSIDPMASKKGAERRKIWAPESGIIVAGLGDDGHGYILKDLSFTSSPSEWATAAIEAYHDYEANAIVLETNQGGDMAEEAISLKDPTIKIIRVWASDGKWTRAEPVAMLYEQGKVHHIGTFAGLEDQQCNWSGKAREPSPDRLDALVHALTDLMIGHKQAPDRMNLKTPTKKNYWGQI